MNGLVRPRQATGHVLAFIRRPFGVADGNRFIVLGLSKPLSNVLAGANLLGNQIIRMVLVSSVFAFLLAILFARALTQPLQMSHMPPPISSPTIQWVRCRSGAPTRSACWRAASTGCAVKSLATRRPA